MLPVSVVTITLHITYDPAKRLATLLERGLDFEDAPIVLTGPHFQYEDLRKIYGETRMICYGYYLSRLVVVCYVQRGNFTHIFSMRKANGREKKRVIPKIGL